MNFSWIRPESQQTKYIPARVGRKAGKFANLLMTSSGTSLLILKLVRYKNELEVFSKQFSIVYN